MSNNKQITSTINFTIWANSADELAEVLRAAADRVAVSGYLNEQGHFGIGMDYEYQVEKVEIEEVED